MEGRIVCDLDASGALIGKRVIPKDADPPDGALVFDHEVDLPIDGSYRYDPGAKRFEPIEQIHVQKELARGGPPVTATYALFLLAGFVLRLAGKHFPDEEPPAELQEFVAYYRDEEALKEERRMIREHRGRRRRIAID